MTFPRNEAETIQLYKLCQHRFGWQITHLQTAFPDAVIENRKGQRLIAEFEFDSKNFHRHGHDPDGCDVIIAYTDSWENPPVPVWALRRCAREEVEIIKKILNHYMLKRAFLGLFRNLWLKLERFLQGKYSLKDLVQHRPDLAQEYEWGYEFWMHRPMGWDWAVAIATPPGWGVIESKEAQ